MADADSTATPLIAGRYRVERQIGQGGGGRVFRAWDETLQRPVALKRFDLSALPAGRGAVQEALHLSSLQHPNIVTIHDFGEDADGAYVVLEYLEGETLDQVVERGAFPLEEFARLAQQTLDALAAAHDQGLQHRDLKPANLMLLWSPDGTFRVKILDFGLAKLLAVPQAATTQHDGDYLGSIHTMPPELLKKQPLDARSDLYSLGCVFYYTLTQRMPFVGETIQDVIVSHLQHQLAPLGESRPDLPAPIVQWVETFLEVDPALRFHTARQALALLARLLQPAAPAPPPTRASAQPGKAPGAQPRPLPTRPPAVTFDPAPTAAPAERAPFPWAIITIALAALAALWLWVVPLFRHTPEPAPATAPATASSLPIPQPPPTTPRPPSTPAEQHLAIFPPPTTLPAPEPPPAPPVPATPTPPPPPPAGGVFQASDLAGLRSQIGKGAIIEGQIVMVGANKTGTIRYLDFDRKFNQAINVVCFVKRNPTQFTEEKLNALKGKKVRVNGMVETYKDALQLVIDDLSAVTILPE